MAEAISYEAGDQEEAAVHIVHLLKENDIDPEVHHIKTLATVLGSEEAARSALLYSYSTAMSGFSAKLTPKQVEEISKLPGVLQVQRDQAVQLASGHK
ncbi:subtilisin-like protease SBT3.11 isoform X2 [Wolffia australiana]